ncbi:MAG TPA: hypothetical protein VFN89_01945 [Solirubrobacterales bacterium]|nr:hypothetical protein [Solirubrobacterales bacterium]
MTLDVYAHVFDEFDIAERASAEDQIAQARRDVSGCVRLAHWTLRARLLNRRVFPTPAGEK